MAVSEHETKTKVDNLQEHLGVLKRELDSVSTELNEVIVRKNNTKAEADAEEKRLAEIRKEQENTLRETERRLVETQKAEAGINKRKEEFESYCKGKEDGFVTRTAELDSRERHQDTEIAKRKVELDEINVRLSSLSKMEEQLLSSIEENKKILEVQTRERRINEETIDSQRILFNEEVARFDARISDKQKEYDMWDKKVIDEEAKVQLPLIALKREEEADKVRKSNLDIYESRVRARWNFLFPGRSLNI